MKQELVWLLDALLLPPGGLILLGLLGLVLSRRFLGKFLILLTFILLYLLSAPFIAERLMAGLETYPPVDTSQIKGSGAQAIIVLGGGRYTGAPEYGGDDTVGRLLLERLRYAARLSQQTSLPIIPSGGSGMLEGRPEAAMAQEVLQQDFGVDVLAIENKSRTTKENAQMTAALLSQMDIKKKILLVSHAWHMPRAVEVFTNQGIAVIPAPTGFVYQEHRLQDFNDWLPDPGALHNSYWALHEYLGRIWYNLSSFF